LNPPKLPIDSARLESLTQLPRDADEPVFAQPWQAQAFALAIELSRRGFFTWPEWTRALANELKRAAERRENEDGSGYYHHWLAALEHIVIAKGLADLTTLQDRKSAWIEAYRHTPHGNPVAMADRSGDPR